MTTALTSRSQTHGLSSGEEKIYLNPHRVQQMLVALNLFWLFITLSLHSGGNFWFAPSFLVMMAYFEYFHPLSVSLSKEFAQLNISKHKFRLLWTEIENAEMSEKQDRLVVFAGHDKRITIPLLKGNPPLREQMVRELESRNISISTTKRAAYYETKNSELRKNVR